MVIVTQEEKKQTKLIYLLIIVLIITALILGYGFFWPSIQMEPTREMKQIKKVGEIDFGFLKSSFFKGLQPFEEIKPFEEEVGRENPFLPY